MRDHFIMFANYNGWANYKLYHAAAELSVEDYNRDCSVAFTSMNGTLNHLLVTDEIWMDRFQGITGSAKQLESILHEGYWELLDARRAMDDRIINFCANLTEEALDKDFTYTPITTPEEVTQKLSPTLAHLFNHQTHHRGQAHALLTRLAGEAPSLDLIYYQRELRLGSVA